MTLPRSHGKARPELPRSRDLPEVPTEGERPVQRDAGGRFAAGNAVARGRGWRRACAKMLGRHVDDPVAHAVSEDAWRLFCAGLRDMPNDGPTVRALLAQKARHDALAGFWSTEAAKRGLTTKDGMLAEDRAMKHGAAAMRLAVVALDIASRLATRTPRSEQTAPAWMVPIEGPKETP